MKNTYSAYDREMRRIMRENSPLDREPTAREREASDYARISLEYASEARGFVLLGLPARAAERDALVAKWAFKALRAARAAGAAGAAGAVS